MKMALAPAFVSRPAEGIAQTGLYKRAMKASSEAVPASFDIRLTARVN
jgi:hypothetical protein